MKRNFNCPVCKTRCAASEQRNGKTKLKHPLPLCEGFTPGLLMQAYVIACKPPTIYPSWDDISKEIYRKGVE
jgi:hypothetical protein